MNALSPIKRRALSSTALKGSGGLFGGGSSSGGSTAVADTLQAVTYASAVDLLCEGPIAGFTRPGYQSFYLNGTAIQNADGSFGQFTPPVQAPNTTAYNPAYNFPYIQIDYRLGLPNQSAMAGFPGVEASISNGSQVTYYTPIIVSIEDLTADTVRVTMSVQALYATQANSGDVVAYEVAYAMDIQQVDGPWITYTDVFNGKTTTTFAQDTQFPLPGVGPWNLRIRRLTPDDLTGSTPTSGSTTSPLFFTAYTTIQSRRYAYPDSAIVGMTLRGNDFGGKIPVRTYEIAGLVISIPSNYDPNKRTYSGVWDGTFKTSWSNNPAWILYDILTNDRYGLGRFMAPFLPDKWSFYSIGQYCDVSIPDGFGGMEPRYTFNGPIPSGVGNRVQAWQAIQTIALTFHGMVFWGSGQVWAVADMPADPVGPVITQAHVIGGLFTYSGIALKARHLQALITWNDPNQQYQAQVELVQDLGSQSWNQTSVQLTGCTSRGQAHRHGKWILDTEKNATQTVTFSVSWELASLVPGDIIQVADPIWAGIRSGGRIAGIVAVGSPPTVSAVTLDQAYTFQVGKDYQLTIVMPDGTLSTQDITNATGTTASITLAGALSGVPLVGAGFVITGDVTPTLWRVLANKETAENIFEVTALQHDPTKYDRIELGIQLAVPNYTVLNNSTPAPPTGVTAQEFVISLNGTAQTRDVISWTPAQDSRVATYNVQYIDSVGTLHLLGSTSANSFDIMNLAPGIYTFQVQSVDFVGRVSVFVSSVPINFLGLMEPPDDITGFQLAVLGDQTQFTWNPCQTPNFGWYRIRWSPLLTGVVWGTAQLLADNIPGPSYQIPTVSGTYLVKAVTLQGVESLDPDVIVTTLDNSNVINIVQTYEEDPNWNGDFSFTESVDNCLQLTSLDLMVNWVTLSSLNVMGYNGIGFVNEGTYTFAETLDLGAVFTSRISGLLQAFGLLITDTMDTWPTLSSQVNLSGAVATDWAIAMNYRTTNDDPNNPVNIVPAPYNFLDPSWTVSSIVILPGIISPTGHYNAYTLTAGAANGFLAWFFSLASGNYQSSLWIRRRSGSGIIYLVDAAGNDVPVALTSTWQRFSVHNGPATTGLWGVQLATSGDAIDVYEPFLEIYPSVQPSWSTWQSLIVTQATFRAIQWQLVLQSFNKAVTPRVVQAGVTVDMPDEQFTGNNIECPIGGLTIVFDYVMKVLSTLQIAGMDLQQGDYYTIAGKTPGGFTIEWFNSSNVSVDRIFDYHALGYGKGS